MTDPVRLSVLIPVFNEISTLRLVVERVRATQQAAQIIVIDDGSTDGTGALIGNLVRETLIDIAVSNDTNRGKGFSVRRGATHATGDVLIVQDADLEYDPADYDSLLRPIRHGNADAVFGSRFLGGNHRVVYFWHMVGNRFLTLLSNVFTNLNLTDMETGYKAVRVPLFQSLSLTSNRFGFEPELTARLAQAKARIWEVPILYSARTYEEGKKIDWKDGVAAIWHILRSNLLVVRPAKPA